MKSNYHAKKLHRPRSWDRLCHKPFFFKSVKVIKDKERQELSEIRGDLRGLPLNAIQGSGLDTGAEKNMLVKIMEKLE